jgi:YHS domain-containing protein
MRLAPAAAAVEHGGRTYHFCSDACRDTFTADPASYAAPTAGHDATGAHDGHEPASASREATDEHRRTHATRPR